MSTEERPERAKRRPRYDRNKLDGEIGNLGGRPIETVLQDDENWARETLRRANLPTGLGWHRQNGESWIPAPPELGSGPPGAERASRLRIDGGRFGGSYQRVTGMVESGTAEWFAAWVLCYARWLRQKMEAGKISDALHCMRKMTQFRMKGAFIAEIEDDALDGVQWKIARRRGGRAEKTRRSLKAEEDSKRWLTSCDVLHRKFPERSLTGIYRQVGSEFEKHPDTIRKRVKALGFPSSGRLIGEVRARS